MRIKKVHCVSLAFLAAGTVFGQAAAPVDAEALMRPKIERIRNAKAAAQKFRAAGNTAQADAADDAVGQEAGELTPFLRPYLEDRLKQQGYRFALSQIEESRWNKQTGTGTAAAGSTSVVSKGSVPALFGFAVENGALTRSTSGTAVTFRGSPVNIYSALAKGGYIPAGPAVPQLDGSFESIAKRVSFHVSFDTSRGNAANAANVLTGDKQQIAGWGARVELVNKRDPRRSEYKAAWDDLMNTKGLSYINDISSLEGTLRLHPAVLEWRTKLAADALKATDDQLPGVLIAAFTQFQTIIATLGESDAAIPNSLRRAAASAYSFASSREGKINGIMKSWTAALEYNFVKQANTNGGVSSSTGAAAGPLPAATLLPDLGNINFVASKGFTDGPELTVNAGLTWFQSIPSGLKTGSLRDVQVSAQLDFPLKEIQNIGKPTLSFAGQFLSLREEPLGAKILVNSVAVSTKGNIGLLQAKFTIPTKSTGVSIPISVTWANRTELIKEKEVRANFGLSFDLDKLFAKP